MDFFAAKDFDDLLSELSEPDARTLRCGCGVSQPRRKSGALRWKKLKAWL
jgi:hypothetical protein